MRWWTRTQTIRTVSQVPFEVSLLQAARLSVYQNIARKAMHLNDLGLSNSAIARRLGVTDKTIAKAIMWIRRA